MSREKELFTKTGIITIGRISTQCISFFLLPLYTALLTTEEYGVVDFATTIVQLLIPVITLMIDQGVFRYLLTCSDEQSKKRTITSAVFVLIGLSCVVLVFYIVVAPFISSPYKIWVLLILMATAFSNLFLQIARGLNRTTDYALGSFACSAVTILFNVLCIVFLNMGAVGMLIAAFVGNLLCCALIFIKLKIFKYLSVGAFDRCTAISELTYSMPLVPNQLSLWVMNSSDRLIITFILGASANGILAVSHKFPSIYLTFFNIFLLAWHEIGAVHYFDEDRDTFFSEMINKIVVLFSTLCLAVIVALPLVFRWFVNSAYYQAYYNIPIYLIASLFNVIIGLLGVVYVATKKTSEIAKTTIIAAAINIVVNLSLVNFIGLYAASISTFVGYFVALVLRIINTRKYININYDIRKYLLVFAVLGLSIIIYYLNNIVVSLVFSPVFIVIAFLLNKSAVSKLVLIIRNRLDRK